MHIGTTGRTYTKRQTQARHNKMLLVFMLRNVTASVCRHQCLTPTNSTAPFRHGRMDRYMGRQK